MKFKNKFEELKLVRKNFYDDCINMLEFLCNRFGYVDSRVETNLQKVLKCRYDDIYTNEGEESVRINYISSTNIYNKYNYWGGGVNVRDFDDIDEKKLVEIIDDLVKHYLLFPEKDFDVCCSDESKDKTCYLEEFEYYTVKEVKYGEIKDGEIEIMFKIDNDKWYNSKYFFDINR